MEPDDEEPADEIHVPPEILSEGNNPSNEMPTHSTERENMQPKLLKLMLQLPSCKTSPINALQTKMNLTYSAEVLEPN